MKIGWVAVHQNEYLLRYRHGRAVVPAIHEHRAGLVPRDAFIAVYMVTNRKHGTLYIGVISNLVRRAWQHREGNPDWNDLYIGLVS